MPSHYTVDHRVSEFASFSTSRFPKLLRIREHRIIDTRHAPYPKYGAQMTTMMNTPRGIHDRLQNQLAHAADHLSQDRLAERHRRRFVEKGIEILIG